jgi:hypothetical protein
VLTEISAETVDRVLASLTDFATLQALRADEDKDVAAEALCALAGLPLERRRQLARRMAAFMPLSDDAREMPWLLAGVVVGLRLAAEQQACHGGGDSRA